MTSQSFSGTFLQVKRSFAQATFLGAFSILLFISSWPPAGAQPPGLTACYLTCNGLCTERIVDPISIVNSLCIDASCASGIVSGIGLNVLNCIFQDLPSNRSLANQVAYVECYNSSDCVLVPTQTVQCYQCSGTASCGEPFKPDASFPKCTGGGCYKYLVQYPTGPLIAERGCATILAGTQGTESKNLTKVSIANVMLATCITNLCNDVAPSGEYIEITVHYYLLPAVIMLLAKFR